MYEERNNHLHKHLDFIVFDTVLMVFALWIATAVKIDFSAILRLHIYREMLIIVLIMQGLYIAAFHPYSGIILRDFRQELREVLKQICFITSGFLFWSFVLKQSRTYSRIIVLMFVVLACIFMLIERQLHKETVISKPQRHIRNVLLVATARDADAVLPKLTNEKPIGFNVRGIALLDTSDRTEINRIPVVATDFDSAVRYIEENAFDEVMFANAENIFAYEELMRVCAVMGLTTHVLIKRIDLMGDEKLEVIGGMNSITSCMKLVSSTDLIIKRFIDIIGAIVGLAITAILFIFTAPAIYISDPGPIFFKQPRIGQNGKVFYIYKFRSMYQDAEARKQSLMDKNELSGNVFKMEHDPRIIGSGEDGTKKGVGWFIRTFSIDEFPQFLNVLKGDMSLVGTRPPTCDEWEAYEYHHRQRMRVKPGITGLWQVSGRNEITDFEEIVRLDTKYIREWSLMKDIEILLKTIVVVITRKGSN